MPAKPNKGDYAIARRVVHGDYRDTDREGGVVVGVPNGKDGYYQILSPNSPSRPFRGHVDDAQIVPDSSLTPTQRGFR